MKNPPMAETDIVARLRALSTEMLSGDFDMLLPPGSINPDEAADYIESLRSEVERLKEALKPFADECNSWPDDRAPDDYRIKAAFATKTKLTKITVGHLRQARAALAGRSALEKSE